MSTPLNTLTRNIGFSNGWAQPPVESQESSLLPMFDVRVMAAAISESGGEAADSFNLGTVHYTYDDMANNDGRVTLPYG